MNTVAIAEEGGHNLGAQTHRESHVMGRPIDVDSAKIKVAHAVSRLKDTDEKLAFMSGVAWGLFEAEQGFRIKPTFEFLAKPPFREGRCLILETVRLKLSPPAQEALTAKTPEISRLRREIAVAKAQTNATKRVLRDLANHHRVSLREIGLELGPDGSLREVGSR